MPFTETQIAEAIAKIKLDHEWLCENIENYEEEMEKEGYIDLRVEAIAFLEWQQKEIKDEVAPT